MLLRDVRLGGSQEWSFGGGAMPTVVSGMTVKEGSTLTVPAGTTVKSYNGVIYVRGTLVSAGSNQNPAVFTAFNDDTKGGDSNGSWEGDYPGNYIWAGISVADSGRAELPNTEIRYAWTGLNVWNGGEAEIHGAIFDSQTGVNATTYVDATNVDWGSPSGPSPIGSGTKVVGNAVDVVPWVGSQAPVRPTPSAWTPTPNPTCQDFFVIGARGSGEAPQGGATYSSSADGFGARTSQVA